MTGSLGHFSDEGDRDVEASDSASLPLTIGSLCTGYGGLDIAVEAVFGGELSWLSEIDESPALVCRRRFPHVRNLGNLTAIEWADVPRVDVLTAGFPCQDLSYAGKGAGLEGERSGLWFDVLAAVRVLRPRWVVVENVAALLGRGLDVVTHGLASSGYVGAWTCVRASDIGACHRRERVFIVAANANIGHERAGLARGRGARPANGGDASSDTDRWRLEVGGEHDRWSGGPGLQAPRWDDVDRLVADVADADGAGLEGREPAAGRDVPTWGGSWGDYEPAVRRHELVIGRPAPPPVDDLGRLAPRFVEWMMMLPDGWVTDVLSSRTNALKCLGNGVVPPQAEFAVRHLLERTTSALREAS